jgi:hypothetical protein
MSKPPPSVISASFIKDFQQDIIIFHQLLQVIGDCAIRHQETYLDKGENFEKLYMFEMPIDQSVRSINFQVSESSYFRTERKARYIERVQISVSCMHVRMECAAHRVIPRESK